jgi:hypothetical protein
MREFPKSRPQIEHPYAGFWMPLEDEPSFVLRSLFGTKAVYLDGKMMLGFSAGEEPWRGILVCTAREHHASLLAAYPALRPHPILGKWLYLPESADSFERVAEALVRRVRGRDPRIGVVPLKRKRPRGERRGPGRSGP